MKKIGTVTVTTGCTSTSYERDMLPNGTYDLFIDTEKGKRFLGTFYATDGTQHEISRDTPVDILLDCIVKLSSYLPIGGVHR